MAVKLGEMLVKAGLISSDQLQEALGAQKSSGEKLGYVLVSLGYVKEDEITQLLSEQYGVPSINLRHFEIDASVIGAVPEYHKQRSVGGVVQEYLNLNPRPTWLTEVACASGSAAIRTA